MRNGYRRPYTPRSKVERLIALASGASAPHDETQARVDVFPSRSSSSRRLTLPPDASPGTRQTYPPLRAARGSCLRPRRGLRPASGGLIHGFGGRRAPE